MNTQKIYAVVVTFNRKKLLIDCLTALGNQTQPIDKIIIVDNASTDGTVELLKHRGFLDKDNIELLVMQENEGGAGGFSVGLEYAFDGCADWVWMMDDDAEPKLNALEELMKVAINKENIYGSLAVNGNETSWLMTLVKENGQVLNTCQVSEIPEQSPVFILPFLGFMIHRELVRKIGFPDADYFISGDDVEYSKRAKALGADIIVAGKSHIIHPIFRTSFFNIAGFTISTYEISTWKRYYDTRNRILTSKKYTGARVYVTTLPSTLVRMVVSLIREPNKKNIFLAYLGGIVDGLLGRKGRRHEHWGLNL